MEWLCWHNNAVYSFYMCSHNDDIIILMMEASDICFGCKERMILQNDFILKENSDFIDTDNNDSFRT